MPKVPPQSLSFATLAEHEESSMMWIVVDKAALDGGQFAQHDGLARLNRVFNGELEQLLGDFADEVWKAES